MVDINRAFPSKYLEASDLQGQAVTALIDRVEECTVWNERRYVVFFAGRSKGLLLTRGLAKSIEALTGSPHTEDWHGTRIRLYAGINTVGKARINIDAPPPTDPAPSRPAPAPPAAAAPAGRPVSTDDIKW